MKDEAQEEDEGDMRRPPPRPLPAKAGVADAQGPPPGPASWRQGLAGRRCPGPVSVGLGKA